MPSPNRTSSHLAKSSRTHAGDLDCDLVKRAARGDHPAFETLVRRHKHRVFRTTLGVTRNNADAKDAARETFIKVHRPLEESRCNTRFATWLTHVAVEQSLMMLRKRRPAIVSLDDITATEVKDWGSPQNPCEELSMNRVLSVANNELAHAIFLLPEPETLSPKAVA
ncbi:MAG TPA: sigma factor [Candidatus Eremiobacteraceae bacterium]|nr:sigma factor [Candidatus Eremiobacteraceae bacterium]